ncbi:MAG: PPOX class F420-dependent oxidoreductase [Candidatus Binatus sp.]|uniref:PPOX class F420-dependent oxidoreductase n=1 Tax=Candidatus Binatus sp. TaxID=2811406 RepID=UPI00271FCCF2|nr:PPOX class F420-dependent oxidoreductase [Candidatus Binatus sp.]MDO8434149.1 PPOX class F420-dependent oxidoreductase [Candidatus Binatus sp.]
MPQPTIDQLAAERYVSLVTFRRNGKGVPTPIWIARAGDKLYAFTDGASAKMKRLRVTDRIQIAACDARGIVRGEFADGRARKIDDPAIIRRALASLSQKYGWQMSVLSFFSRLSGRIKRRAYLEISL